MRNYFLIAILLLLAFASRLYDIQTQSLWFDEGWSAYAASQPTLAAAFDADLTNPPLYYVLLNISTRFLGDSELALRLFSLFAGLIVIALAYQLGRRFAGTRAGLLAALLATIAPPLWWASQEARMYTLLAIFILIAALAWHRLKIKPSRGAWIALWLAEIALLYTHNTGVVAVLWLNTVTLIVWIIRRRLDRPDWRVWLAGQVGVGVIWLPYFVTRFLNLTAANSAVSSPPEVGLPLVAQIWQGLLIAPWSMVDRAPLMIAMCTLIAGVALLVIRRRAVWLLIHAAILIVWLVVALIILGNELHGRYLVMIVPLVTTALAIGLARSPRILRLTALVVSGTLFAFNWVYAHSPDYGHDDARAMVQYYAEHLDSDDSVLMWSYADRYELAYYWDRLGVQADRITLPEGADLDAVLPLLPESGDVALNIWYTQRADFRGMMDCVLQHGTINPPERHTVYGMSNLLYRSPTPIAPELTPVDLAFTNSAGTPIAHIDARGVIPAFNAGQGLCLPLRLSLLANTDAELKAALIAHNALGWEIARADAVFAQADQRTSPDLAPGESLTAYPLLRLPYGTPAGSYDLYLRLYDEVNTQSGFNPPPGETVAGRDVLIGTWEAQAVDWNAIERETDLPYRVDLPLGEASTLIAHNQAPENALANGEEIRLSLLWRGEPQPVALVDDAGRWRVDTPLVVEPGESITLDWRSIHVPPDADSGSASLLIGDTAIAGYQIESQPMVTDPPPFEHAVDAEFPGVGTLVGYTLSAPPYTRDNPPQITLVWQAEAAADVAYTVFVQLVNAEGRVIAQSDSQPARGARPTMGWRSEEYIVDEHTLTFNDLAAPGNVRLIAGLYDGSNGRRVPLADGTDAATLMPDLVVE